MATEWSQEEFDNLWRHVPGSEFLNNQETEMYSEILDRALEESLNGHTRLDETEAFQEFLEELGLAVEDFDWNYFREWVEAAYSDE